MPGEVLILSALSAVGLAIVHVFAGKLRFLTFKPRSRWLSAAGGVSLAYVFVHVLPDLARSQEELLKLQFGAMRFLESHVYLLALTGLLTFYGLERLAKASKTAGIRHGHDSTSPGVFWLHIGMFGIYNGLIGYLLLHRETPGRLSLLTFFLAMSTHFLVNDHGLRHDHKARYDTYGRWLLSVAVLAGWTVGAATEIHKAAVAAMFGFLAGGVVLNVLKEEIPEERESTFWALVVGAVGYAVLLLAI